MNEMHIDVPFLRIPLNKIKVDYDWNGRRKCDVLQRVTLNMDTIGYDPERDTTGIGGDPRAELGLVDSIRLHGQTDPVDVVPNRDPRSNQEQPYKLIAGFRRITALGLIADQAREAKLETPAILADPSWDWRNPTVVALVRPWSSHFEARLRNLAENTNRDTLSTPDFCWGVADLVFAAKEEKKKVSNAEIAANLGKCQSQVSSALTVMALPISITRHWRECGKASIGGQDVVTIAPLPFDAMLKLAKEYKDDPDGAERAYVELCRGPKRGRGGDRKSDASRLETARKAAVRLAEFLGWMRRRGFGVSEPDFDSLAEMLLSPEDGGSFVKFERAAGGPPTDIQRSVIAKAMANAFHEEEKDSDEEPRGDEDEGATGVRKRRVG